MNRRKYREAREWLDRLKSGGYPDIDGFYAEWKAKGLPPINSVEYHTQLTKTRKMVDDLERKNDKWPPIFTMIAAFLTIVGLVLAYLFIR